MKSSKTEKEQQKSLFSGWLGNPVGVGMVTLVLILLLGLGTLEEVLIQSVVW